MAFKEVTPAKVAAADLAVSVRRGVAYITLTGVALAALPDATACRVLYDEESRTVRIIGDPGGAFAIARTPRGRTKKDGTSKRREAKIIRARADIFDGMVPVQKVGTSFKIPAADTIEFTLPTAKVATVTTTSVASADARAMQKDLERELLDGVRPGRREANEGVPLRSQSLAPRGRTGKPI